MEEAIWELRKNKALKKYRLANRQWQDTGHPFFKEEMKYRAVIYRACSALLTERELQQASFRSLRGSGFP